jgi:hypothetical protein
MEGKMRVALTIIALALLHLAVPAASAQPVVTNNPRAYMETLSNAMGVSGMTPLRSVYEEVGNGAPLNPTVEAALLVYERGLPSTQAVVSRVSEDIMLSDTLRSIYLYHYYGENYWVHTRVDFVRISGDGMWAVAYVGFASEWNSIVINATPGFRPAARN